LTALETNVRYIMSLSIVALRTGKLHLPQHPMTPAVLWDTITAVCLTMLAVHTAQIKQRLWYEG